MKTQVKPIHKEKGAILVFTALALVLMMGMAGLAIDFSNAYTNKTLTQNLADSLALSAAISLVNNDTDTVAEAYARTNTFPSYIASTGNTALSAVSGNDLIFTFADTASLPDDAGDWSTANGSSDQFVRVQIINRDISTWFMPVLSLIVPGAYANVNVNSSAVAGLVQLEPCDLSPIMMCSDIIPSNPEDVDSDDQDHSDGIDKGCADGDCYGYNEGSLYCLTQGVSNQPANDFCESASNATLGAGNVGFLDFGALANANSGASTLKKCLADGPLCNDICESDVTSVPTKTGNNWGPVREGIESLFNLDTPDLGYASDKIVGGDANAGGSTSSATIMDVAGLKTLGFSKTYKVPSSGISFTTSTAAPFDPAALYNAYTTLQGAEVKDTEASLDAEYEKRVLTVPMADCSTLKNGNDPSIDIVGYGCFFLTAVAEKEGSEEIIMGTFIDSTKCLGLGESTSNINTGFFKVILYQDLLGNHS